MTLTDEGYTWKTYNYDVLSQIPVGSEIIAADGTLWKIEALYNASAGRRAHQNMFKDISGPTPYANLRVDETCNSAWRLHIADKILKYITDCTIKKTRRVHSNTWSLTIEELEAFIAIIYVRESMGAKGIDLDSLWSEKWGNAFVKAAMSRDKFREIMKYFYLVDVRSTRSQRLKDDKFALVSEIWLR
ncbi:uncharacterized protein [Diabrotica undecimpunctata]|uniref:uncharacterized protein n=1 Tax=Diabrotica undecimpunctata TaxID=50387 RepID=UPI003B631E37